MSSETDPLVTTAAKKRQSVGYKPKTSFADHFSLETPSDEIRFNACSVRVYSSSTKQFQIVEKGTSDESDSADRKTLQTKTTSDGSSSLSVLRACYTLITLLMVGFLLIFAIQVLFFLFVSLISDVGLTSQQSLDWYALTGTILSIPVMVYGLASALTVATEFVVDTWNGHEFFRSVLRIPAVVIDWFYLVMYVAIPLGVMLNRMYASNDWWVDTAMTWFGSVTVTYLIFCSAVFMVEMTGALELLVNHPDHELLNLQWRNVGVLLGRAIVLRQINDFSGVRTRTFLIEGTKDYPSANISYGESDLIDTEHTEENISIYSKFTRIMTCCFKSYNKPKRMYNVEDVLDRITYVTDSSWNLEKMFCRRKEAREVLVVNGRSRILPSQIISSSICTILGNVLIICFFAALLTWGGQSTTTTTILTILFIFYRRREFYRVYVNYDTYQDTIKRRTLRGSITDDMADSEVIYRVSEKHCVTRPTEKMCWFLFLCEILGLFVFPLWQLCRVDNTTIAVLFALFGVFSACRHYISATVVLGELGSLDLLDGAFIKSRQSGIEEDLRSPESIAEDDWREKNRLAKIVGRISQGNRRDSWIKIIAFFVLAFLFLFLSAFAGGSNDGEAVTDPSSFLVHDFEYAPRKDTFKYPTCDMTGDFPIPGSDKTSHAMLDYAYLAWAAYASPESMPELLNGWFGEGVAYDDVDTVDEFQQLRGSSSAAHYKLIRFPANPEFAVMTIRGTSNGWDMISDAQLWSATILAQVVRTSLPFGEIWDPILEELVSLIAVVQSASLRKVAFYVQTTDFVNYLKSKNIFPAFHVTGHSLGGGLAMITGAQTQTPAIGLSGPNTMITRNTLDPPVTVDNLNAYTFNIMPERDPVAMIDDPARNTQRIACLADTNDFVGCHSARRSLCDIMYTCGNGGPQNISRPVFCECVLEYGYPEPKPTGDRTFAEACSS